MGKKGGSQTTTSGPDQFGDFMRHQVYDAANQASNQPVPGANDLTNQAAGQYGQYANLGLGGAAALAGDPNAAARFMNPYQQQVMDQMNQQYGDIRKNTIAATNDAATQAGAFGGSRQGVAEGTALAQVGKDQAMNQANLLQSGYNSAMNQASQSANLGMGATSQLAGIGDYLRNIQLSQDPSTRRFQMMLQAQGGMPQYGSQTATGTPGRNPGAGFLGGAATGAGIGTAFGPIGTGVGAGIGGILGLF
jgi:hypothetical protein